MLRKDLMLLVKNAFLGLVPYGAMLALNLTALGLVTLFSKTMVNQRNVCLGWKQPQHLFLNEKPRSK